MLDGEEPVMMHPWYKNFKGTIQPVQDKYVISGEAAILPGDRIEITELPIGTWTNPYHEVTLKSMLGTDKIKPIVSDFKVHIT